MDANRMLLIVNPRAGTMQSQRSLFKIVDGFCAAGYEVTVRVTQAAGDAFATAAGSGGRFDIVVCVGGDGTLNEVTNGLMAVSDRPRLGYIPCGSTNDFASSLRLPKRPLDAARKILAGAPCPIDVGRFKDRYFNYVASFGAFTESSYAAPHSAKNYLGHLAYILEGIKDLPRIRPYYARVTVNNRTFEDEYIFGGVTNTLSMGGILKLDRLDVSLSDGVFEIILVKNPVNAVEVQKIVSSLTRQQFDTDLIEIFRADRAVFEMDEPLVWTLDGERAPGDRRMVIDIIPGAIEIML